MASDLFAGAELKPSARKLTVFRAELLSCDQASWEELFDGFTALQAITFSGSLEMLLRLADRLDTLEIVFGSEKILSREHLALTQASQTIQPYGFADALVDQKALVDKYQDGGPEPAASGFRRQSRSVRNARDRDRSQQGRIVERGRRNRIWPRDRGNLAHRGNT